jgi:hypothetical protein
MSSPCLSFEYPKKALARETVATRCSSYHSSAMMSSVTTARAPSSDILSAPSLIGGSVLLLDLHFGHATPKTYKCQHRVGNESFLIPGLVWSIAVALAIGARSPISTVRRKEQWRSAGHSMRRKHPFMGYVFSLRQFRRYTCLLLLLSSVRFRESRGRRYFVPFRWLRKAHNTFLLYGFSATHQRLAFFRKQEQL